MDGGPFRATFEVDTRERQYLEGLVVQHECAKHLKIDTIGMKVQDRSGEATDPRQLIAPDSQKEYRVQSGGKGWCREKGIDVWCTPVLPSEAGEFCEGQLEEPTTPKRKLFTVVWEAKVCATKGNVQIFDASRMPGFSEGFEHEVPFTWISLVGEEPVPPVPVARARWLILPTPVDIHCYIQRGGKTPFQTHLDKTATVTWGDENRGPCPRVVDQRNPPEFANMGELRARIHAFNSSWRCEELEYSEEDLERDFVDGASFGGWQ